jgi:hypothetical protein
MWETAVKLVRARYPKEHRYMMRLWTASWKISKLISIAAIAALTVPGAISGFFIGKFAGTTNIYNNIPIPNIPTSSVREETKSIFNDIASLSDSELVSYTVRFSAGLRIFESNATIAQQGILVNSSLSNWEQNQKTLLELTNREQTEFRNTFLHPAEQLRDEIMKRLQRKGIFIQVEKQLSSSSSSALKIPLRAFDGILAGPTPIANMADWLETAARKLLQ